MYTFKKILTVLFCIVLVCLLILPVGMLYVISRDEQSQYRAEAVPAVEELAYGDTFSVTRRDIYETITVSGTVVSASELFMELNVQDPYGLRLMVSVGDVIRPGELIAYDGDKEVVSDSYGLIREISLGTDAYIRLYSLEDLALECYVNDTQRAVLERTSLELRDDQNAALTVLKIDDVYTGGNTTRVLLRYDMDGLRYGQTFEKLTLTTGKVYTQALVVRAECVYRKVGSNSYFLRVVDQNGRFLSETEVQIGYTDGTYICVSGIEEGTLCDSGYKALVEG